MDPMERLAGGRVPVGFDAQAAENMEDMEKQFAVKGKFRTWRVLGSIYGSRVVQHMQTYWSILEKVKGSSLRLTKMDEDIYNHLKEAFPEFDPAAKVDEDAMKSKSGKDRWRAFMMAYEKKIGDYNFGTMVRNSPKVEYEEDTTIFVPRMQFYAIEIARNKNGLNDWIYDQAQARQPTGK